MFVKFKRKRNQDGTFKKDVGWTPWNEAWEYKMSDELKDMVEEGHRAVMLYIIQRTDKAPFRIANEIDKKYKSWKE